MKKKKLKWKSLIFIGVILLVGIIGVTLALYFSEERIVEEFKAMTYKVSLKEEWDGDFGTKKVSIINDDERGMPVLIRFNYNESWEIEQKIDEETIISFKRNVFSESLNSPKRDVVTKNWNEFFAGNDGYLNRSHFCVMLDGWYYYKRVLKSNEEIPILESIEMAANRDDYSGYTYNLSFNVEAIQADPNHAMQIWGIDGIAISEEGDVDWPVPSL